MLRAIPSALAASVLGAGLVVLPVPARAAEPFTLVQMNLCLSGLAGCYARTMYPAVVDEAVTRIRAAGADAVTLNEACSGDVATIAAAVGYTSVFSTVRYDGGPLSCRSPGGRGVFGDAVLVRGTVLSSTQAAFATQEGAEERRYVCVVADPGLGVCTSHLATTTNGSTTGPTNDAQCAEVTQVLTAQNALRPTVFAGDVNRRLSCAPTADWTVTDLVATQAQEIQHAYGPLDAFLGPTATTAAMTYTDHDALVVTARRADAVPAVLPEGRYPALGALAAAAAVAAAGGHRRRRDLRRA